MTSRTLRSILTSAAVLAAAVTLLGSVAPAQAQSATSATAVTADATKPVEVKGKLDGGAKINLAFASLSNMACFPATERANFTGNHVFYTLDLPAMSEMTIEAVPDDPKLDVSLYAYRLGTTGPLRLPPSIPSAIGCEASYDQRTDSNPGVTEKVLQVATTNPYRVVVGVAGANGTTSGGFTLRATLKTRAAAPQTGPLPYTRVPLTGATTEVAGDLASGKKTDLAFAARSSMACFPATENVNFDGNHVLYRVDMPAYTRLTVTATPDAATTDVSVYAYMVSATDTTSVPPTVPSATTCEAGYDQRKDSNPGAPETLKLNSIRNPYAVYIGVAGANGTTAGTYKLKIAAEAAR